MGFHRSAKELPDALSSWIVSRRRRWALRPSRSICRDASFLFRRKLAEINPLAYDLAHQFLELVHTNRSVHQDEIVRFDHLVVVAQDSFLENAEAFGAIKRDSQIHAGFVVLQLGT